MRTRPERNPEWFTPRGGMRANPETITPDAESSDGRPEPLLTAQGLSKLIGMSPAWIYEHASGLRRPQIPCVKVGASIQFRRTAIKQWIREILHHGG